MAALEYIYSIPNLLLFFIIFIVVAMISIFCLYIINKLMPLKFRYAENTSIGFVSATIGVVYAVLAGFIILYVMNNYDKASDITTHEAEMVAKTYRNAEQLPNTKRDQIQNSMRDYINTVIRVEWPTMSKDKINPSGQVILEKLSSVLNTYKPDNQHELLSLEMIIGDLDELYNYRQQRIEISETALSGDLWILLVIVTFLTIIMSCMIGVEIRLHIVLQIIVALMVSAMLFLIISLDRPFLGYFSIQPTAYQVILQKP